VLPGTADSRRLTREKLVHGLTSGATGALFADVRYLVHVTDLASALVELAGSSRSGINHVAAAWGDWPGGPV